MLPTLLLAEDKLKEKFEINRKYIADALEYSGGTHSIDDVYQACRWNTPAARTQSTMFTKPALSVRHSYIRWKSRVL